MILHAGNKMHKDIAVLAIWGDKYILAGFHIHHRMMQMHGAARFILNRLGHESGKAVMPERGFSDQTFVIEHFIS